MQQFIILISLFTMVGCNKKDLTNKNPLSNLKSQYEVITYKDFWRIPPGIAIEDTTYVDTVYLTSIEQGVNLKMSDNIERDLLYHSYEELNDDIYFYLDSSISPTSRATLTLNKSLETIVIEVNYGWKSGGTIWKTQFDY